MEEDTLRSLETHLSVLMEGHRMDMIEEQAKKILAIAPEHRYGNYCLLYALANSQKYPELFDSCTKALEFFPNEAWPHGMIYYYYLYKGGNDYLNAKKHIEEAIKLEPLDSSYQRDLAEIYLINREPEKALQYLRKCISLSPENAEYRSRMGLALIRTGKLEEALSTVLDALKDSPGDKNVLDNAGMVYILSGELDKGEELFRDALSRFPTYNYFQAHLDWVLREKKDRDQRNKIGKSYTPLYLRQKDTKKYFD